MKLSSLNLAAAFFLLFPALIYGETKEINWPDGNYLKVISENGVIGFHSNAYTLEPGITFEFKVHLYDRPLRFHVKKHVEFAKNSGAYDFYCPQPAPYNENISQLLETVNDDSKKESAAALKNCAPPKEDETTEISSENRPCQSRQRADGSLTKTRLGGRNDPRIETTSKDKRILEVEWLASKDPDGPSTHLCVIGEGGIGSNKKSYFLRPGTEYGLETPAPEFSVGTAELLGTRFKVWGNLLKYPKKQSLLTFKVCPSMVFPDNRNNPPGIMNFSKRTSLITPDQECPYTTQ